MSKNVLRLGGLIVVGVMVVGCAAPTAQIVEQTVEVPVVGSFNVSL